MVLLAAKGRETRRANFVVVWLGSGSGSCRPLSQYAATLAWYERMDESCGQHHRRSNQMRVEKTASQTWPHVSCSRELPTALTTATPQTDMPAFEHLLEVLSMRKSGSLTMMRLLVMVTSVARPWHLIAWRKSVSCHYSCEPSGSHASLLRVCLHQRHSENLRAIDLVAVELRGSIHSPSHPTQQIEQHQRSPSKLVQQRLQSYMTACSCVQVLAGNESAR
jgi:hypothetical protein